MRKNSSITLLAPTNRAMSNFFNSVNTTAKDIRGDKGLSEKLLSILSRHLILKPFFVNSLAPKMATKLQTYRICEPHTLVHEDDITSNEFGASSPVIDSLRLRSAVDRKQKIPPFIDALNSIEKGKLAYEKVKCEQLIKTNEELTSVRKKHMTKSLCVDLNINSSSSQNTLVGKSKKVKHYVSVFLKNDKEQGIIMNRQRLEKCIDTSTTFLRVGEFWNNIVRQNIATLNGVVHVVNRLLCHDCSYDVENTKTKRKKKMN